MIRIIFNGNSEIKQSSYQFTNSIKFYNEELGQIDKSCFRDTILISVDCKIRLFQRLQDFNGFTIYRKLLQLYNSFEGIIEHPFNVILYSILSVNQILRIKPENELLHNASLKFIQISHNDSFLDRVNHLTLGTTNPNYNVAADNLLRGYKLSGENKITIPPNRRLLIIDDFYIEYKWVFELMFQENLSIITPDTDLIITWRNNKTDQNKCNLLNNINRIIKDYKPDFVLSDFYIAERHKENKHIRSLNDVVDISGYIVFKFIKENYPWIPYMFFTTSNKIWNYDVLRNAGVWSWVVKDTRVDLSSTYLIEYYIVFKSTLEKIMNKEWLFAIDAWKDLIELKERSGFDKSFLPKTTKDPKVNCATAMISELFETTNDSFKLTEKLYSAYNNDFNEGQDIGLQVATIISKIGGLCERFNMHYHNLNIDSAANNVGCTIYLIRAFATHQKFYEELRPIEVIFLLDIFVSALGGEFIPTKTDKDWPIDVTLKKESDFRKYSNYGYYIQYFEKVQNKNWKCNITLLQKTLDSFNDVSDISEIVSRKNKAWQIVDNFIKQKRVLNL